MKKSKDFIRIPCTNKKKSIILAVIAILVLLYGASSLKKNYRLGQEIYDGANTLSCQTMELARRIGLLADEFEKTEIDPDKVASCSSAFHAALFPLRMYFVYDNIPILNDVRREWVERFEKLYQQTSLDDDLEQTFADYEKREQMHILKNQLESLTYHLMEFSDMYNQIPEWKRYFVSWEKERKILSEECR